MGEELTRGPKGRIVWGPVIWDSSVHRLYGAKPLPQLFPGSCILYFLSYLFLCFPQLLAHLFFFFYEGAGCGSVGDVTCAWLASAPLSPSLWT